MLKTIDIQISFVFSLDGQKGYTGDTGYQGNPGIPGLDGLIGLEGERGDEGLRGESGEPGNLNQFYLIFISYSSSIIFRFLTSWTKGFTWRGRIPWL